MQKGLVEGYEKWIEKTPIGGLIVFKRPTFEDERGWFREPLRIVEVVKATGINFTLKQVSHSLSKPGVIRALHWEEQNKIVYPITGKVFSAYVDARADSPTFGQAHQIIFEEPNDKVVFIPKGVANSVCNMGETAAHYIYLIDEYYDPKKIKGIAWNDPDLNINWPVKNPIVSERDKNNPTMRQLFPEKYN